MHVRRNDKSVGFSDGSRIVLSPLCTTMSKHHQHQPFARNKDYHQLQLLIIIFSLLLSASAYCISQLVNVTITFTIVAIISMFLYSLLIKFILYINTVVSPTTLVSQENKTCLPSPKTLLITSVGPDSDTPIPCSICRRHVRNRVNSTSAIRWY